MTSSDIDSEMHEDEKLSYMPIEDLEKQKIVYSDIKKMKDNNYGTVQAIAFTPKRKLEQIRGVSSAKVEKLHDAAYKLLGNEMSFKTATEIYKKRKDDVTRITTGSKKLDELLGGGIETGSITEIFGEFRTGKTQICHQLAVTCQLNIDSGGAGGPVLYIDTQGTFRPSRIKQIAKRYHMNSSNILDNISFARAYSTDHQMKLLKQAHLELTKSRYKLIIIDSGTSLFRTEFTYRGCLQERDVLLSEYCGELLKLCDIFNVAVVITNQVVLDPTMMSFGPQHKPYGDEVIAHSSTTRIYLRKGAKNCRIAKLFASCNLPEEECMFSITDGGIIDE